MLVPYVVYSSLQSREQTRVSTASLVRQLLKGVFKKNLPTRVTIASWLKETLTLANSRASGGSTRKVAATYAARQGASLKTIMESGDWSYTSKVYGHYIRCLPRELQVRILEQTSACIQGVNVEKIATNNPH